MTERSVNPRLSLAGQIRQADARGRDEMAQRLRAELAAHRLADMSPQQKAAMTAALRAVDTDDDD